MVDRQTRLSAGQKNATRDDTAGGFLCGRDRGGDKLAGLHDCSGDDEVNHLGGRDTV